MSGTFPDRPNTTVSRRPQKRKKNYKEISNGHLNMKHHAPRAIYKTDN